MTANNELNEALLIPNKEGNLEAVVELLAKGADANCKDQRRYNFPHAFCISQPYGSGGSLTREGADVNAKNMWDYTPLKYAAKLNLNKMKQLLIEYQQFQIQILTTVTV